jgi:RNA 3'-terminal phosphate cyclase (ATP)
VGLITIDGAQGGTGGQIVRAALTLSGATGQGFELVRIRADRLRPGLKPEHVDTVRAAALVCGARTGGAFDGSPDLRFEPRPVARGEYRFEVGDGGSVPLVIETVAPILATASEPSRIEATGGTHVPASPSAHFLAGPYAEMVAKLGLPLRAEPVRAGFRPRGGGEARAEVGPWARREEAVRLDDRGALVAVRGFSGAGRMKEAVAERARDAALALLWQNRRIEASWEIVDLKAASPGSFLLVEAVFENGRGAFGYLGDRSVKPELLGERAARRVLKFIEEEEGALDPWLADQLAVPLALAGGGGRLTTTEVTRHLETVASVCTAFGRVARVWGRRGGPGGLEVERC